MKRPNYKMNFTPRPYQQDAIDTAVSLIESSSNGEWHLFVSPTGTGKSLMELGVLAAIPDSILITPRIEIIAGMLLKLGHRVETLDDIITLGSGYGLYTPIRLRNLLAKGDLPFYPSTIILDECHHSLANSWQDIQMYLNGIPVLGFTASPFRGTPKGTQEFREQWDSVNNVLTLQQAVAGKYCSIPTTAVWPLIDDDLIDIQNGELVISQLNDEIKDQIEFIITRMQRFYNKRYAAYDRPTMISVPSTEIANLLTERMNSRRLPAVKVTQDSTREERARAFEYTVDRIKALVQIDVVSEGVDLPIRRLIDIRPTMSPVKWLQQIGRIMRPTEPDELPPEYICLCRNLERHCYLMEGMLPPISVVEAQEAFTNAYDEPIYSKRSGVRAIGLEGLGKFITTPVHLLNGITCFAYNLVGVDQFHRTEYFVLVHPGEVEPLRAQRVSVKGKDGNYEWGKWALIESIPDTKGFTSAKSRPLTEKQTAWWLRSAEGFGLNPHKEVNERSFQVLPLLKDLRITL